MTNIPEIAFISSIIGDMTIFYYDHVGIWYRTRHIKAPKCDLSSYISKLYILNHESIASLTPFRED